MAGSIASFSFSACTLVIDGTTITTMVPDTLDVQNTIGQRSQTSFDFYDFTGVLYDEGTALSIKDPSGTVIYSGFVDVDTATWMGTTPAAMYHTVTCKDNQFYAERRYIATSYQAGLTAGYVVNDLFHNYLAAEGVTVGSIASGAILPALVYNYRQLSTVLSALAKQSGYWWNIDENKQLWFMPYTGNVAPWTYDGTQSDNDGTNNPKLATGNAEYRNRQYTIGGYNTVKNQTEYQYGDGKKQAFALRYQVSSIKAIYVNGVAQTFGTKGAAGYQWYYTVGDTVLAQDPSGAVLGSGDVLEVVYDGRYPTSALAQSDSQIVYRQGIEGGGTGYVDAVYRDSKIYTLSDAFLIASAQLSHFGQTVKTLTFRTPKTGLKQGQLLTANFPAFCGLNEQMLIQVCEIKEDSDTIWYYITALGSPIDVTWQSFMQGLVNAAENIDPNSLLSDSSLAILVDVEGTYGLEAAVTLTTWSAPICAPTTICAPTLYVG